MAKGKKPPVKKTEPIYRVIALVITVFIAALLFISIIGIGGSAGSVLSDIFFGIMGKFFYVFPFYLIFSCFYIAIKEIDKPINPLKVVLVISLFFFMCLLIQAFSHIGNDVVYDPLESFEIGRDDHAGGGLIGGAFGYLFLNVFGLVGALLIDIFGIILLLVLIFKDKIVDFLNNRDSEKYERKRRDRVERGRIKKSVKPERKTSVKKDIIEEESNGSIRDFFSNKVDNDSDKVSRIDMPVSGIDFNATDNNDAVPFAEDNVPETAEEELYEPIVETNTDISEFIPEPLPMEEQDISHISLTPISNYEEIVPEPLPETVPEPVSVPESVSEPEPVIEPVGEPVNEPIVEPVAEFVLEPISETITEPEPEPTSEQPTDFVPEPEQISEPEPVPELVYEPITDDISEFFLDPVDESSDFVSDSITEDFPVSEPATEDIETEVDSEPMKEDIPEKKEYVFPYPGLLDPLPVNSGKPTDNLDEIAEKLVDTLRNFGVEVSVSEYSRGPAVTRFEIIPSQGVKVSKILNLADDIKLNLAAADIRIEAPIPGKSAIGIEVPNKNIEMVHFRELIENTAFTGNSSAICFAAGKDIGGNVIISDIAKMPHVLIAGQTGSGKSVCINTIIMSILYKSSPDDVKLIMIDPKVVELSVYNGIPHLLIPVVSDPKKAAGALNWAVREMNDRYQKFAALGVRDLAGYNKKVTAPDFDNESGVHKRLYQLVVIVDELADLMMVSSSEVEESICRLAQLARACGIHLVVATQRPSVNVITGLIKANMPSRIAFAVTSGTDSRTILDMNGAEKLLGRGDMLYFPQGLTKPLRVQGAFVTDDEVIRVTEFIRNNNIKTETDSVSEVEIENQMATVISDGALGAANTTSYHDDKDEYFAEAGRFIISSEKGSIGMLQRKFKIGFNRAARIMDQLAEAGIVGPEEGTKPRKILVDLDEFENILKEG